MKAKLKLEHLSAYFPYQVKAEFKEIDDPKCRAMVIGTVGEIADNGKITCYDTVNSWPDKFKLLLRPLSEIKNNIDSYPIPLSDIVKIDSGKLDEISYSTTQWLLAHHYDIFGLIEQGLAKPINK